MSSPSCNLPVDAKVELVAVRGAIAHVVGVVVVVVVVVVGVVVVVVVVVVVGGDGVVLALLRAADGVGWPLDTLVSSFFVEDSFLLLFALPFPWLLLLNSDSF